MKDIVSLTRYFFIPVNLDIHRQDERSSKQEKQYQEPVFTEQFEDGKINLVYQ